MSPEEFLRAIWSAQKQRGYVFVAWKDWGGDGEWHEKFFKWPGKVKLPTTRDLYFCPNVFSKPERKRSYALPTVWLHADLDEVRPDVLALGPTAAWSTSPDRYQCLWRSTKPLSPSQHEKINQRLTYKVGADKGGWSITKVLRVPGTESHKYGDAVPVTLLWEGAQHYLPKVLVREVRDVSVKSKALVPIDSVELPEMTASAVFHKHHKRIPKRAKQLINSKKATVGERSERLWELECLLMEAGLPAEEALILVRDTVWNKFAGSRRELPQLWSELQKAKAQVSTNGLEVEDARELRVVDYDEFMDTPIPEETWTVEGVWSDKAHGLLAGEAKSYKSLIAFDLAVAVASGSKFLDHFPVPEVGPVLIVQEENKPYLVKDRLQKIAHSRGLTPSASVNGNDLELALPQGLPISLMNNCRFDLTSEEHFEFLDQEIARRKPKLVVLDPLYLMAPGVNENSASDMAPILRNLLYLKQHHGCGILIVHHYNKPREDEDRSPGNRISGTNVFYRWFESAIYMEKLAQAGKVKMSVEHREAPSDLAVYLEFDMGGVGELDYHVDMEIRKGQADEVRRQLQDVVAAANGKIRLPDAADELGVSKDRAKRIAERMGYKIKQGKSDGKRGRPALWIVGE